MGHRRTEAEIDQDRKLAFVPVWPLVAVLAAVVLLLVLFG